jgi:hypothetical protein
MSTLKQEYGTEEEVNLGFQDNLIAGPINDQVNATIISKKWAEFKTNPTDYGSAKIPPAKIGAKWVFFNDTDNVLSVFPSSGESINNIVDYQFNVAPRSVMVFEACKNGKLFAYGNSI